MVTDVPVTLRIEARPDKREIAILIVLDLPTGSVTVSFARRAESMAAAGAEADEIAASLAEKLPAIVQKQRWLAGESASSAELAQPLQAERWFMNEFV